ncbi:MAG: transketolase [Candidatus Nomurabacteria bacterium]|nr:transketolase [Candidatus Nomurabacteria bacterium]
MATIKEIERHALNIRRNIIKMLAHAGSGHTAGALGLADVFAAMYFDILRYNPENPDDPNRDILVVSNGHVCPALYAALAEVKLIPEKELIALRQFGSRLQGHPQRELLSWLETTSGPLGEGLSQSAGMAYALKYFDHNEKRQIYCITGDGELDEGSNWEALMFAAKNNLHNMTMIIDRNNIQIDGTTEEVMPLEPLADKLKSFGMHVIQIDGNSIDSIIDACSMARAVTEQPTAIIAYTIPGKGVDFMENDYLWHGKAPNKEEAAKALGQLEAEEL